MAKAKPLAWISMVLIVLLGFLWEALILTACIPPIAGQASGLSNLHLLSLTSGNEEVRFSYFAFCTAGVNSENNKPAEICVAAGVNANINDLASHLPNVNKDLFNLAFILRNGAFPPVQIISGVALLIAVIGLFMHWFARTPPTQKDMMSSQGQGGNPQMKKMKMKKTAQTVIYASLGINIAFSLASALAVTDATFSAVSTVQFFRPSIGGGAVTIVRGDTSFGLQWFSFVWSLVMVGFVSFIMSQLNKGENGMQGGGMGMDGGMGMGMDGGMGMGMDGGMGGMGMGM